MTDVNQLPPYPETESAAPRPGMAALRVGQGNVAPPGVATPANYRAALRMIRDSVRERDGLISGRYDGPNGTHCAVGCFFADNYGMGLHSAIVEEVAAFNDSIPETATPRQRRNRVLRWLNGRLFRMAISDLISGRSALYLPLLWRQS